MKKFCIFVALCSIILLSACKSKQASSSPSVSLVPVGPVFVADSAFAYCQALFVANGMQRQHLGEVVLVAFLFLKSAVDIGQLTIIIGIVSCSKRLPETAPCRVFMHRAGRQQRADDDNQ